MNTLTIKEAAKKLGVTPARVRKMRIDGRFPGAVQRGGVWFLPASEVDDAQDRKTGRPKKDNK